MIYIDASRYSNTGKRTGVENYSYFVINELVKEHGNKITLISPRRIDLNVKQIVIPFPRLWTLFRLSWEILKNKSIDNLFVPSHVLPLIRPKNCTITIHDVVFKYSPESYSLASRIYLNWAAKYAVKHARNIIVPSEATKHDLIKFYKAKSWRIHVVPLGFKVTPKQTDHTASVKVLRELDLEKGKYFLYLGRIEYKKNTDTLIKAYEEFAEKNSDIKLFLAGFPGYGGEEILKNIPKNLTKSIIRPGYINEIQKEILLENTLCFIFPSRFEGFGIPLLEAMHAGVPIIASNIPSSKEIAENNALFFKKEDPKELTELMHKMADNSEIRKHYSSRHRETLEKYSWHLHVTSLWGIILNPSSLQKNS